ncbi:MAG TPA: sigma-70 family RNA polymerase sigma factor [Polyangia bacterium]|nr:sigma-70 family RNA polymerase sigma factor [Polyangia bacterium]
MSDYAPEARDESPHTLGDLLYAGRSERSVPEDDWVLLVRAIAGGDHRALRDLFERTHRLAFTLAMRITGNRESAEEVTLDVFRDVWLKAAQYDPEDGPVLGWIMNQTRSRAIDRLRFEQRKKRVPPDGSQGEPAAVEDPEDALDVHRRRGLVRKALATLTPEERRTVETAFFSELTYAETASRLDQPLGTVKTRVRSALAKLRRALENEGDLP